MKKARWAAGFAGLLLAALGIGYLAFWAVGYFRDRKDIDSIEEIAMSETEKGSQPPERPRESESETETIPAETETGPEEETEEEEGGGTYISPIDFEALWEVNPDIYAWISIDDTDISYPILQSATDNSYYLNHTPERKRGFPGSIFTYNVNAKDFTDFNTVIYGHRMDNGLMFSNLKFYRDEEYLASHRTIRIYLPDRELVYKVFAAVVYDNRLITSYYDFSDPASCAAYLRSITGNRNINSHILTDLSVSEEDRIITLSTCIKGQKKDRYLVVAVLEDEIK